MLFRSGDAADTLLRVLSSTDQTFETLLELLLTTLLNGEVRQAELLVSRAHKELDSLEKHRLRGALAEFLDDLATVQADQPASTRALADDIAREQRAVVEGLDDVLEVLESTWPAPTTG